MRVVINLNTYILLYCVLQLLTCKAKATITWCDLLHRFFVLMLCHCVTLKAIRYESTSLNRIAADKSRRVIVA